MSRNSVALKSIAPKSKKSTGKLRTSLTERRSDELVFGFVGPVFSGSSTTARTLGMLLKERYGYEVEYIKISQFIDAYVPESEGDNGESKGERFDRLQTDGNLLRGTFGDAYLAEKAVEKIALNRVESDSGYERVKGALKYCKNRRTVHLIDSLKHPEEVKLLRDVYGDLFWLVGVFAPESIRKERAREIATNEIDALFIRDEDEGVATGQQVRKTMHLADIFIRNDGSNTEKLEKTLQRFLHTLFNTKVTTPLIDEIAMFTAASAACSSGCLSRQVGAAIYSKSGELLSVGKNDPPKFGGGLYSDDDQDEDHRCHKWKEKCCHNDRLKDHLYADISQKHSQEILNKIELFVEQNDSGFTQNERENLKQVITAASEKILRKSEIKDLIEYSRAIHAEMEAIIAVARAGKQGLKGATLYCTTFPCHNCARHIVASGIEKVIYIEPYPKSLAVDLHSDAISIDGRATSGQVRFLQYDGIAPKNMMKLYQMSGERKMYGSAVVNKATDATPVFRPPLDGFSTYEQIVVSKIKSMEEEKKLLKQ